MESYHSRLVSQKCLPKQGGLNSAKTFAIFSCRFIVVHISPTRTGELSSHHPQNPMRVEDIHTTGCCPVPRRDRLWHYHLLIAMQPSARCLAPWLRGSDPVCSPRTLHPPPPPMTRTPRVGFWRGASALSFLVGWLVGRRYHASLVRTTRRHTPVFFVDKFYVHKWQEFPRLAIDFTPRSCKSQLFILVNQLVGFDKTD
jgi:hypothetical protein